MEIEQHLQNVYVVAAKYLLCVSSTSGMDDLLHKDQLRFDRIEVVKYAERQHILYDRLAVHKEEIQSSSCKSLVISG